MKALSRKVGDRAGRSSKGFLFLVLLGMFFVVFVLPKMTKRGPAPAPAGPGGGIVDTLPAPGTNPNSRIDPRGSGGTSNGDWKLEEVDIGGTKPAPRPTGINIDNFGKGGTIELPGQNSGGLSGIRIPDGRTPGINPDAGVTIDTTPATPDRTEKGDWSIEEVKTKPASSPSRGIQPVGRTKAGQKTTKGDWTIEAK